MVSTTIQQEQTVPGSVIKLSHYTKPMNRSKSPSAIFTAQQTLAQAARFEGIGLHSGKGARVRLLPAAADHGIVFYRSDLARFANDPSAVIEARYDRVSDTSLCTVLTNGSGAAVRTIEHLMAALAVKGIDNLLIEIDAEEVPILDGSCAQLIKLLTEAGITEQHQAKNRLEILRPVTVEDQGRVASLKPRSSNSSGLEIDFEIEFSRHIGKQAYSFTLAPTVESQTEFDREIAAARTFCLEDDIAKLQSLGFGLGGSLDNAVVVGASGVLNPNGLHYPDEFVRHKVLDAIGDLALAGAAIDGHYYGSRAGHQMTNLLLRRVFSDKTNYRWSQTTAEFESPTPIAQLNFA